MQILVIALIILLLFGASRLGEVGKGLGDGVRNFKKGLADDPASKRAADGDEAAPTSSAALPAAALAETLKAGTENGSSAEAKEASAQGQAPESADKTPEAGPSAS